MNELELRMYGLVPYNISPIQQAIQFGHAVVEYGQKIKKIDNLSKRYDDWANNWKTFIILNGGTTNHRTNIEGLPSGTLNNHVITLLDNDVDFATFNEPDLGDQLTAVVFIVDERVFNKKKYPDFNDWILINYGGLVRSMNDIDFDTFINSNVTHDRMIAQEWLDLIGGSKNIFLRKFLSNFKLA